MKKISLIAAVVSVLLGVSSSAVLAAANPSGTGQPGAPNVSCGSGNATTEPKGFSTDGFAHAGTVYAGSPGTASAVHAESSHAVSQYDIACYQLSQ